MFVEEKFKSLMNILIRLRGVPRRTSVTAWNNVVETRNKLSDFNPTADLVD